MIAGSQWEEIVLLSIARLLLDVSFAWKRSLLVILLLDMQYIHVARRVICWNSIVTSILLWNVQETVRICMQLKLELGFITIVIMN